jgi:LAS superfamily LD-carboxypeptidase LdcB
MAGTVLAGTVLAGTVLAGTVLTVSILSGALPTTPNRTPPGPLALTAAAATSPTSIAALREDVKRTSDRLAAATTAWERGQQELARVITIKIGTERASDQLAVDADAARRRASSFAAHLYMNPVDPLLYALASGNARSLGDIATIRRVLGTTQQIQQDDSTLLNTQAQQTKDLVERQQKAALQALRLQTQLDDALSRLQADAAASLTRLQTALAELHRRQVAAAAALASSAATGSGATCNGPIPTDSINGLLPASALCPLQTARGHRLVSPAATAFDRLSTAFAAANGTPLCITDSYRDYAAQVQVFKVKPNLAATPGRSQHGWGRAVDLCGGVQSYGTPPYLWLKENAATYGFVHPDWAEPDGSRPEPWHWEFRG